VVVSVNHRGGCACTRQRRLREPQRLTKNRWNLSFSAHQAAENCDRDWTGWESLASTVWFRRAGYGLRQSLVPAKMALKSQGRHDVDLGKNRKCLEGLKRERCFSTPLFILIWSRIDISVFEGRKEKYFTNLTRCKGKHQQVGIIKHVLHINAKSNSVQDHPQTLDE